MAINFVASTNFGSLSTYVYPGGYDQTKLGLGPIMMQVNDAGNEGKWVGPIPVAVARPLETAALIPAVMPSAVTFSSTYDYVVLADGATATATRRFQLWRFNRTVTTSQWSFSGYITCTIPFSGTQNTYLNRGHSVSYEKYTTGTVSITNGTAALVGVSSTWTTDRIFIGSRIGFGSTDPTLITNWYEIGAVGSDTTITLTQNYGVNGEIGNLSGASYVIEDLRIVFVMTNASTLSNAGVFMAAGLRWELFQGAGTTIPAATTVDKIRAVYWLSDGLAATNTVNQAYGGIVIDTKTDWINQKYYALDCATGTSRFQVGNFRGAMTLTAGRTSTSTTFLYNTGQQAVSGTVSQNSNNLVMATPNHGARIGVKSLFWVTATRIYSAAVSGVTTGSVLFQSGSTAEYPPGTTTTYPATSALASIDYAPLSDCFFVLTSGATAFKHYWTQYKEDSSQFDRIILADTKQTNQSTVNANAPISPVLLSLPVSVCCLNGLTYLVTHGTTAITNFIYNIPFSADWDYAAISNSRVVLPVMTLTGFVSFVAGYVNRIGVIGSKAGSGANNLGMEPGAVRLYYRTTGISDNSGSWNLLDDSGDMTGVTAASTIQGMLEFRTLTTLGIPGRVTRVGFEGGGAIDEHFQFSQNLSSSTNKEFAFRYSIAFGGTVPTLYIRLYDAVAGTLLLGPDNTATPTLGIWEKTTNGGGAWSAYDTTDKGNETTYLRYTPTSIADNISVLPVLGLS